MTSTQAGLLILASFGIFGLLWGISRQLDAVNKKLGDLVDITHRIRIEDRDRDF